MADDKLKFMLISQKENMIKNTKKIIYKGNTYNMFYIWDLFTTFSKTGTVCHFPEFISACKEVFSSDYTVYPSENIKYSIVAQSGENKELIHEIIGNGGINASPIKASKAVERISNSKTPSNFYEDGFSSSEEEFESFKTPFTSKLASTPSIAEASPKEKFIRLKEKIVEAFDGGSVIPTSLFNGAMSNKHGISFNYKTTPCDKIKHKHANLSKFLLCCGDIVKVVHQKYAVHLNQDIIKRRLSNYAVPTRSIERNKVFVELLIVNLFSVQVTIPFDDLEGLFRFVYKKELSQIIINMGLDSNEIKTISKGSENSFSVPNSSSSNIIKNFILRLKSKNINLVNKNDFLNALITPFWLEAYQVWYDEELHNEIFQIEKVIQEGEIEVEEMAINIKSIEVFAKDLERKCSIKSIPGVPNSSSNENLQNLFKLADLNIPKMVQRSRPDNLEGLDFGDSWKFLKHSINFNDKSTFLK